MPPIDDMFQDALLEFRSRVGEKYFCEFKDVGIGYLKKELSLMQKDQIRTKSLRNMRRIEPFLKAFEEFDRVAKVFLNASMMVCYVWGPVKMLMVIARRSVDHLDMILDAYEKLGQELPLLLEYQRIFENNQIAQEIMVKIFADVLEFHHHAIKFFSGPAFFQFLKSVWKSFRPTFNHILSRLRSHRELLEKNITMMNTRSIQEHFTNYEQDKQEFAENQKDRLTRQHEQLQHWIATADVEREHLEIQHDLSRYPNSGKWILKNEKIKDWLLSAEPSNPLLWMTGNPGIGKTYLSSIIVEACTQQQSSNTGYFFCSDKSDDRNTATSVLRGLVSQLVRQNRDTPEVISYCLEKKSNSSSPCLSAFPLAKSLMEFICPQLYRTYIVVDGLDECQSAGDRRLIVEALSNLVKICEGQCPGRLRVIFLSRPLAEIDRLSLPQCLDKYVLDPEHNGHDIEAYCLRRFSNEYGLQKLNLSEQQREEAINITCTRANGMFLFARLVMDNLAKQPHRERFFCEIAEGRFPRDLNAAYSRIMERLEQDLGPDRFDYTLLLLGWLVKSKRPLKWSEIQVASSVDIEHGREQNELNSDIRLCDRTEELCGSLVQVLPGDRIELVHSTAKLFIETQKRVDLQASELDLNLRCLRYLTLKMFDEHVDDEQLQSYALKGDFAFQDYAVSSWFLHFKAIIDRKNDETRYEPSSGVMGKELRPGSLAYEVNNFVAFYSDTFKGHEVSSQATQDCQRFQGQSFHQDLLLVWNHICAYQAKDIKSRGKVSINLLDQMLVRNRELVEALSATRSNGKKVAEQYGIRHFKCNVVFCFYFHEGFLTQKNRDKHTNCHERPFQCEIEDCSTRGIGLTSNNALQKHMRTFHPNDCEELGESFAQLGGKSNPAKYSCTQCDRAFTRKLNLMSHEYNHRGEKPFSCSECGKAFARKNDVRRHEEIHQRHMG